MMRVLGAVSGAWISVLAAAMMMVPVGMAGAQANSPQLTAVLAKMDTASRAFRNAQAEFQWEFYQKIVRDTTTDKGSIYFERSGGATDVGVMLDGGPGGKAKQVVSYTGTELQVYTPAESQLQVFHNGGNNDYQGLLTLGFGGSGSDLQKDWKITDMGPETLTIEGEKIATEKLNLDPVGSMAKSFKNVTMWVDTTRGIGVKEIFYTATGGNYRTATYSHIRLNGRIEKSKYGIGGDNKVKTDKGTQVFQH